MLISEIFESIQGEGEYTGVPALFIRTSGCNKNCSYCDTKYHKEGTKLSVEEVIKEISKSSLKCVVWTGGEPMLQIEDILKVMNNTKIKAHMLETNGSILRPGTILSFSYIAFSPKNITDARKVSRFMENKYKEYDIKVVTDLEKVGKDLIPFATMLMPLTTKDKEKNEKIKKKVWEYCVKNGLKYSPRIHVDVWGNKRGK